MPTLEELTRAVKGLQNGTASGQSGILPELLKCGSDVLFSHFLDLINTIWTERSVPQDWVDADIIPVTKKGDLTSCDNWRGTALLDIVGKLLGKLVLNRLQLFAETVLPEEQCGFFRNRSCTDMTFVVRQLAEKCYEH